MWIYIDDVQAVMQFLLRDSLLAALNTELVLYRLWEGCLPVPDSYHYRAYYGRVGRNTTRPKFGLFNLFTAPQNKTNSVKNIMLNKRPILLARLLLFQAQNGPEKNYISYVFFSLVG